MNVKTQIIAPAAPHMLQQRQKKPEELISLRGFYHHARTAPSPSEHWITITYGYKIQLPANV